MRTLRALRLSMRALFAHKIRAALAISSIGAGVVAVVVTGAIGEGTKQEVLRETESMGANLLVVTPLQVKPSAARPELKGQTTSLILDDYQAITALSQVSLAAPGLQGVPTTVKAYNHAMAANVLGTTFSYIDICSFHIQQGRFLSSDDDQNARRVAILGARVNSTLFHQHDAVGQQIRIGGVPFEVIGVFEPKGLLPDGSDQDGQIVIPIRAAMQRLFNLRWLTQVFIRVREGMEMDQVRTEITGLLRDRHRLDLRSKANDFSIQDKTQVVAGRRRLSDSLTLLTAGLATASLVVGGVGILALMLMLVRERTTEIGLRMAIGAKRGDILFQFLLEAASIAVAGWVVGFVTAIFVMLTIARETTWKTGISAELVLSTLAIVTISGLGFGSYPARKASMMPPVLALRTE